MRLLTICLLLVIPALTGFSQTWNAHWITTHTDSSQPNSWYCYRKNFTVDQVPAELLAKISVDTKYWLWINGKMIVYEGGLKRGPNPRDSYYDVVDLAPYTRKGQNTIAVLTWFWGGAGFSHNNSKRTALLFDCKGMDSDKSWKAMKHTAYGPSHASVPNWRLSEPNIFYDARKEMGNWFATTYNDTKWPDAIELGKPPMAPWNKLVKRNIPLFKFDSFKNYPSQFKSGDTLVCNLPYNGHFSPYFKIRAKAGKRIFIATDSYYMGALPNDSLYTLCSEYITHDGVQEYESLGWLPGHEMRYVFPEGVEVLSVSYRETGYNADVAGSFTCSDPFLNKLWSKALRTLYVNMRDNFMDCPDRERAQWVGDGATEMAQLFYTLDRRSDSLTIKYYLDLINWQKPDGVIYGPVPETNWEMELPNQSLMAMSELWRYFIYSKDTNTIRTTFPAYKKYLSLWTIQPNGYLEYRKGGWDWADWGDHADLAINQHGWYLLALQSASKIATLLGEPDVAATYQQQYTQIKNYLNSNDCWNGKVYRYKDHKGENDDRANALMVLAGVADSSKWPAIIDVLAKEEHASPWMEKFVLESLIRMNEPEKSLARMKKRYKDMVESKYSTLWELWTYTVIQEAGNSGNNHAWTGGPLTLLSQFYAGITPDENKKDVYIIKPMLTGLKYIKTEMPTFRGKMTINTTDGDKVLQISGIIPPGASARVAFPKAGFNGSSITSSGKIISVTDADDSYYWVAVKSGKFDLKINRSPR